jgi:hypothetical protein
VAFVKKIVIDASNDVCIEHKKACCAGLGSPGRANIEPGNSRIDGFQALDGSRHLSNFSLGDFLKFQEFEVSRQKIGVEMLHSSSEPQDTGSEHFHDRYEVA